MRILMLTSSYPKYPGETTAPFIEEIATHVAAEGHVVHVVAPWHPDICRGDVEQGVHLHFYRYAPHPSLNVWGYAQSLLGDANLKRRVMGTLPFAIVGSIRGLADQIKQHGPFDLIHAHWAIPNGLPAALVAQWHRLPLVVSLHGSDVYVAEKSGLIATAAAQIFHSAAATTACSSDLLQRGIALGAQQESTHLVPYGINPEAFRPTPSARARVCEELRIPPTTPIVLGLGRLVYKKGFDILLEAWPRVLESHPTALLVIAGYGDLREQLETQAERLGVERRVRFVGQLERLRAATYLAAANVFTLPIVRDQGTDGLPNVLLEAMGSGCPVVASQIAGVPDVVEDGVSGLLVPERDPQSLAEAITRLLSDNDLAQRLGAAARHRIETTFTWQQTAARFINIYQQSINTFGGRDTSG